jgi:hypothetical protein
MTVVNDFVGHAYEEFSGDNPIPKALTSIKLRSHETLNVVAVISNPCLYQRRYHLAREFFARMNNTPRVHLYVVELCYNDQRFAVTDSNNKFHLQLRTSSPALWHKEAMINCAVRHLLPASWTNLAWIDADIEYSPIYNAKPQEWASDALKVLRVCNVVQLFNICVDMDADCNAMTLFQGGAVQYVNKQVRRGSKVGQWHPGFAWACTREFYDQTGGILDTSILGSADHHMFNTWIGQASYETALSSSNSAGYRATLKNYHDKCWKQPGFKIRMGYIPYTIRHWYHGSKLNRQYQSRWQILIDWQYTPDEHLTKDENGLLIASPQFPAELSNAILQYFHSRKEDSYL